VIRVLIAEDMHMIRGALVALLSLESDMEVVAELDRGDQVIETAVRTRPDVAILDIDLPGLDGLTAAEQLYARLPGCQTLVPRPVG
jgi:two-component system, NarL family, response regulator DesR